MTVFKCKMCGGTVEFEQGATVGTCDSCGTKQTLPKFVDDDERKANLYDRANHFRRNNDFDKAMGIYETILNEDKTDAEAYWSIVLCKYGIEYVEDPATRKRIPTVNRTQFASVLADEDYKSALEYATIEQKIIYESEAKAIDKIQKGILEISQKEEPFDVFICYKESDESGRRTRDSVLANDLYHQLTQEGFKVFFSRITLEDKLGTAYEPYIFAALNSAKVMVVIGTKPEYFKAVWVKNEWSRYLALIKKGAKKVLIPAYKDMDPYDLPEEFSHLQAQDMSKLGFMQDLIRGIKKLANAEKTKTVVEKTIVKETVPINNQAASASVSSRIERIFLFLESGDWSKANEYCEKVLDVEPKNAQAYLGKLMAELKVRTKGELKNCEEPFDTNNNSVFASRFNAEIAEELKADNEFIRKRVNESLNDNSLKSVEKAVHAALLADEYEYIMEEAYNSETVVEAYADYEKYFEDGNDVGIISEGSWVSKLFGREDIEVRKYDVLKKSVGSITMMEGISHEMTWYEAIAYVLMLNRNKFCGFSDWRLPTKEELEMLCQGCKENNYNDNEPDYFWSSSTASYDTDSAWGVYFDSGHISYYDKSSDLYVRCVR